MNSLTIAAAAVRAANEKLAGHAGRRHRACNACLEVGVLLLAAEEAIEEAIVSRSDNYESAGHGSILTRPGVDTTSRPDVCAERDR